MTEIAKEFATPDRSIQQSHTLVEKENGAISMQSRSLSTKAAATVTPPEAGSREEMKAKDRHSPIQIVASSEVESPDDRKVRFNKKESDATTDSPNSTGSQRGLVSRRGGRSGSPGRVSGSGSSKETVLEFKTYRSPPRQREPRGAPPDTESAGDKGGDETLSKQDKATGSLVSTESKPAGDNAGQGDGSKRTRNSDKRNVVSFSPVPPLKDGVRTPSRSPTGGRFQSLPILDDDTLKSPGSFFLSPSPATPSSRILKSSDSFDKLEGTKDAQNGKDEVKQSMKQPMRSPKTPRSPRTPKRDDRDRFLTTPTDFTMDYGKHPYSGNLDSSNVLAWLQSPTANGLFSPGGFSSALNTPRVAPRTPRTPTVSTSFFFSDVAGLPQSLDPSPKPGAETKRNGGRGMSNIICISPLASSKSKNGANSSLTPTINYKDMFASPEKSRGLSLLEESPLKSSKSRLDHGLSNRDPSIDAVQMAERDLMEDADLSVLLQLASNTPKANGERPVSVSTSDGTNVFRSPDAQKRSQGGNENLPSLQLPIIGGNENEGKSTRLARKTHSRDHGDGRDAFHSSLTMRSTTLNNGAQSKSKKSEDKKSDKRHESAKHDTKPPKTGSMYPHHPYPLPPHPYAHPDAPPYYPPGIPPHAGSMRVVVGGQPPSRTKSSPPRSPHRRPYPMGPGDPKYPPPPYPPPPGHYAHHHAVPPTHMHPHYGHYPPHHHPPPRHLPMYGAQHPPAKSKTSKKHMKDAAKPAPKRPTSSQLQKQGPAKKQKKTSPSGATKKKNRSPQLTDKADRQKAAATIQAVNQASGGKNDKAAALAAAILRGVTMRPSGKWQAQLYFAGKSRYIGVFDTREKAALAYEIAREKLKTEKQSAEGGTLNAKATEAAVNAARKAAFEGVNERDPRLSGS